MTLRSGSTPSGTFADVLRSPLVLAPMAGGPGRPELVAAASQAGAFGFLAAGYKTAAEMTDDIHALRHLTDSPFGVNVFVPRRDRVDDAALAAYVEEIEPEAERLGVALGEARWDDDDWSAKVAALAADPVPVVGFTFACPPAEVVAELQRAGSLVLVTVTSAAEAVLAQAAGADGLAVQGVGAGGHQGAFGDDRPGSGADLGSRLRAVREAVDLPLAAAGGMATGRDMADALAGGAVAVALGTAFLRSTESGANAAHRAALAAGRAETGLTRAFSGRWARGIVNRFMADHPEAPAAYPQINNATKALRRESAQRGEPEAVNLWAGVGYELAREEDAATIADRLLAELRYAGIHW